MALRVVSPLKAVCVCLYIHLPRVGVQSFPSNSQRSPNPPKGLKPQLYVDCLLMGKSTSVKVIPAFLEHFPHRHRLGSQGALGKAELGPPGKLGPGYKVSALAVAVREGGKVTDEMTREAGEQPKCTGWDGVPTKSMSSVEPQSVTLWANSTVADGGKKRS